VVSDSLLLSAHQEQYMPFKMSCYLSCSKVVLGHP